MEQRYPELEGNVTGENYPPHPLALIFAQFAGFMQTAGIVFLFAGDYLYKRLTGATVSPQWLQWASENKLMCYGAVYVINMLASKGVQTGAFEVTHNGREVWSKLRIGRMPSAEDIVLSLERAGLESH